MLLVKIAPALLNKMEQDRFYRSTLSRNGSLSPEATILRESNELESVRRQYGDKHWKTINAYEGLASTCSIFGKYGGALENFHKALHAEEDLNGKGSLGSVGILGEIGSVYESMFCPWIATLVRKKALDIKVKRYGEDHPEVRDLKAWVSRSQRMEREIVLLLLLVPRLIVGVLAFGLILPFHMIWFLLHRDLLRAAAEAKGQVCPRCRRLVDLVYSICPGCNKPLG